MLGAGPIRLFMTAGQFSDYVGARALMSNLPIADWLIASSEAGMVPGRVEDRGIRACIPGRNSRDTPVRYDRRRYKRRNRIEVMFGRRKDWRPLTTRYDKCPKFFLSAVALAATLAFWLLKNSESGA